MAFKVKDLLITVLPGAKEERHKRCLGRTRICVDPTFDDCRCTWRATLCHATYPDEAERGAATPCPAASSPPTTYYLYATAATPCPAASSPPTTYYYLGGDFPPCGAASSGTHRLAGATFACDCGAASSITGRFAGASGECGPCGAASPYNLRLISDPEDLAELRQEMKETMAELDKLEKEGFKPADDEEALDTLESQLESALKEVRARRRKRKRRD